MQSISVHKTVRRSLLIGCVFVLWSLLVASLVCATDFVLIKSANDSSAEQQQFQIATAFYGLNLRVLSPDKEIYKVLERNEIVGVGVAANELAALNEDRLFASLGRTGGKSIPLLIFGVGPENDPTSVSKWSGGAVTGGLRLKSTLQSELRFDSVDGFTLQLTDLQVPLSAREMSYLVLSDKAFIQPILSFVHDHQVSPFLVRASARKREVFITSVIKLDGTFGDGPEDVASAFLRIAPAMMFVRYCAGEFGWHALHHYANFTIDDPWLRQPYGLLDYQGLLLEMEKHNFHTTIAFIPWNYNRSEREVVSLFRSHPDRFSIAIHGNNHDHKEFTNYHSRPLEVQTADLAQSLSRMERFQTLTGIPYDKVMIFPHSIAPEGTLEVLREYNFIGTVNSTNVPEGSTTPPDELFPLRSTTLFFGGIPSISRYSAAVPISHSLLAMQGFLDNPFLFYAHSDLFATGINAFDRVADDVNKIEPDVQWRSLGHVVKHLYLVKLRPDSNYDVLALSNSVDLDNSWGRDVVLYVKKQEANLRVLKSVEVDGQSYPYQLENGFLSLNIRLPKGPSRNLTIQYENDLASVSVDESRGSIVIYLLRMGSDFRDIYLGRFKVGLAVIRIYNEHNLKPWQILGGLSILLLLCIFTGYRLHRFSKTRRRPSVGAQKWSAIN